MAHIYSSSLFMIDISKEFDAIAKLLPPGITPIIQVNGQRVFISYSVRCMVRGKRQGLGTFLTQEGAVRAMNEYKTNGAFVKSQHELNAQMALTMSSAQQQASDATAEITKPRESLSMERIKHLLEIKGMFDWQVTAESAIDVTDESGLTHTISVSDQRAYNDWVVAGFDSFASDSDSVQVPQVPQVADSEQSGVQAELSEAEYNRLLGLE